MVTITFEDDMLYVHCGGARFNEQIESCHYLRMAYDKDKRAWCVSPGRLKEVKEEFEIYQISISEYDKLMLDKYFEKLSELHKITKRSEYRTFKPELLLKPPFENKGEE